MCLVIFSLIIYRIEQFRLVFSFRWPVEMPKPVQKSTSKQTTKMYPMYQANDDAGSSQMLRKFAVHKKMVMQKKRTHTMIYRVDYLKASPYWCLFVLAQREPKSARRKNVFPKHILNSIYWLVEHPSDFAIFVFIFWISEHFTTNLLSLIGLRKI